LGYDFEASPGYWLTITTQALHRALNDELAPTGITYRQSQVVGWLTMERELALGELAARMLIEPPTLVGILERMESNGWIERVRCDVDRRRKQIRLTQAAEPVWERIVDCIYRVRARAMAGLEPQQIEQLNDLLRHIHGNLVTTSSASGRRSGLQRSTT
jgi:MarR family transcriptional regulator for hemolysin